MSLEQYSALINVLPQIEEALKKKGEKVPRPNYSISSSGEDDDNDQDEDEELQDKKANIEATSDEEE